MESNTILYKPLGDVIELLTDYHANGAYEKLKENVTLLDKENHAVMIRTTNFEANDFTNNLIYIDEHAYEFLKKSKVYASDLIMNKIANPGTVYFMPEISKPVSLGMNLFLIRVNPKKANPYFIYAYLRKNEHYVKSFASGSTTKTITKDDVRRLKIFMPPLQEQNKIAQILSTWDQAISVTEKLLENSQQQKKALMQQLLMGKKRLLDENGVNFSEGWNEYSLGNLGNTFTGLTGKTKDDFGSGVPYITYMNIFKNSRIDINQVDYVVVKEDENQNSVRYGDIFFTTSSETAEEVGMSSVLLEEVERLYLNSFCFGFRLNNFKVLLPQFAAYILRSSNIRKQISILGQGATRYNLSKNQLMKLILKLPTIAEQKKIAEILTLSDQEIKTLQKKLDCLKQEKKALMQQLLTGKKRVKVAA
ncbi:restriction endonuclease subunit S [Acinetobacter junii]|uniref:restriction endonuclease subunit S n=1 Tax=Acinetobacter junii TaxID=40215 RepID=UPI0010AAB9A8|nr:restriction endonuclease subunit S [Acinetobacter junii]MCU4408639.1 restriction endonuclease subunit S [Acinetobacter junii]TID59753.1 restriction endonuclease subunit S [Acinetobacter junii]